MHALIDREELNRQTFHDPELLKDIILMFCEQTPMLIQAIDNSHGAARADTAHRLKGSALAVGAKPLADAADAVERDPANAVLLDELRRLFTSTAAELAKLLQP